MCEIRLKESDLLGGGMVVGGTGRIQNTYNLFLLPACQVGRVSGGEIKKKQKQNSVIAARCGAEGSE